MKKRIFLSCVFLLTCAVLFAQGNMLSLRQCVETAINNNLDVQRTGVLARQSKINWNQARLNMLPDLNGSATSGINQGRSIDPFTNSYVNQQINFSSYGLSSGVVLFNGLSLQNTAKQNALAYEASRMDWQQAKDNVTIQIILAYLQVLTGEDLLKQSQDQAGLSKKEVERLEVLNSEGAIAPSQLSDLKGQYAGDQLAIINSRNALESAKVALCRLMNVPYNKDMELERLDAESYATRYEDTPDKIYQTALNQFSLVKAVDLRTQSAERGVRAARGQLFPILSLNGNVNTNYSSAARNDIFINTTEVTSNDYVLVNGNPSPVIKKVNNYNSEKINYSKQLDNNLFNQISLNLRIPIFNSLFARNRVKLAKLTLNDNELVAAATKTELQQSIDQAYINMTSASERLKTLMEQVDAYNESFRAADIRFNSGVGNSIDYLTAKNNLDRANISLITARYDYVLRTKILDYYQGKQLW